MSDFVVDTNVPIVANGRDDGDAPVCDSCRKTAIQFLKELVAKHTIVLDDAGECQKEYHKYLSVSGQPGVGDLFYREIIQSSPDRVKRVSLVKTAKNEYLDLTDEVNENFDPSDLKFAALSAKTGSLVVNCVDSDWVESAKILAESGVGVCNLCGDNPTEWRF